MDAPDVPRMLQVGDFARAETDHPCPERLLPYVLQLHEAGMDKDDGNGHLGFQLPLPVGIGSCGHGDIREKFIGTMDYHGREWSPFRMDGTNGIKLK